jgi:hypothetical protein
MKLLLAIAILITSCAPPPDGPDSPQIIDEINGPNYGPIL